MRRLIARVMDRALIATITPIAAEHPNVIPHHMMNA
jgi:hypothetical protein